MTTTRSSRTRLRGNIPGFEPFPFPQDGGTLDIARYRIYGAWRGMPGHNGEPRRPIGRQQDMQAAVTIPL